MFTERDRPDVTVNTVDIFVGQRIKQLRIAHHLTLKDVAELISSTEQGIEAIEAGQFRINAAELFVLAQTFGVHLGEFFCDLGSLPKPFRDT